MPEAIEPSTRFLTKNYEIMVASTTILCHTAFVQSEIVLMKFTDGGARRRCRYCGESFRPRAGASVLSALVSLGGKEVGGPRRSSRVACRGSPIGAGIIERESQLGRRGRSQERATCDQINTLTLPTSKTSVRSVANFIPTCVPIAVVPMLGTLTRITVSRRSVTTATAIPTVVR
jgi:hypothetical protein